MEQPEVKGSTENKTEPQELEAQGDSGENETSSSFFNSAYEDYIKPAAQAVVDNPVESALLAGGTAALVMATRGRSLRQAPMQLEYNPMRSLSRDVVPFTGQTNARSAPSWMSDMIQGLGRMESSLYKMTRPNRQTAFVDAKGRTAFNPTFLSKENIEKMESRANFYARGKEMAKGLSGTTRDVMQKGSDMVSGIRQTGKEAINATGDFVADASKRARYMYRTGDLSSLKPSVDIERNWQHIRNMDFSNPVRMAKV